MALQFIIGSSGSGKTEWVYQKLLELAECNKQKNIYMIVPEQFTMQTQKALVARQKNHAILNIDVVSFDRLAYRIFDELGKSDLVVLEDTGKNLILRKLAEDCKDQLMMLKNQIHRISYIDQIKSLISEFMQYGLEPEDLECYLDKMKPDSALYYKLKDMLLIYQAFDNYLREGYVTSEKILEVLAGAVKESELLKDAVLAFDGFTGFTPVQMKLVQELLKAADTSYVTVTMDPDVDLYADKGIQDLFYMSRKMIRSVAKLAKDVECEIAEPFFMLESDKNRFCKDNVHIADGRFSKNPVLAHLEKNLFRPGQHAYGGETVTVYPKEENQPVEALSVNSLAVPRDELVFAASQIRKLIKEQGYRYQDFAIVSGNVGGYEKYAKEIFDMYEIPYFSDVKETIYYHPFTEWVRALIEMIETGFAYDSVFRYLRCGLSGFSVEEIDILDNYVLERGIRGFKKWNEKWVHPSKQAGRGIRKTDEERMASLMQLNELRERFVNQVSPVYVQVKRGQIVVSEMTQFLYQIMVDLNIQQQLKDKQEVHENAGNEYLAATYGQIYRIVIDLLDKVVDLLGNERMSVREYGQILDAGFLAAKVGTIPPGADCVILGDIERTRLDHIKVLFFLGVNDGIVPKMADRKNLLSQYDRKCMARDDIELAPTTREQVFLQKFYLYLNMTKPEDRLVMTYARMDSMGSAQKPSYLVITIQQMFPALEVHEMEADFKDEMMTAKSSTKQYLKGLLKATQGEVSKDFAALHQWRVDKPEYRPETEKLLDAAFALFDGEKLSPELAKKLYGTTLYNSVTRLEQFFKCAYGHFLQYGLRLTERPEYSFEAADMGTVFHDSIACYCRKMSEADYDWFTITEDVQNRLLEESVSETILSMDTGVLMDSARSQYMTTRISNILGRSVWALTRQIRKGQFVPKEYETSFFQELELTSSAEHMDGQETSSQHLSDVSMVVTGRIDRLDTCENDEQVYVKVMDYKSGKKDFGLQSIYNGQGLQLAVYMHSAIEKLQEKYKDKDVIPAGMLYYHLDDPMVEARAKTGEESIDQEIFEKLRPTGLVNSDEAVLDKLDLQLTEVKGKSDVIPVTLNKDGSLSKRGCSIATREQFAILDDFVIEKMKQAGVDIMSGTIDPHPLAADAIDGCEWCPYQDICGFDTRIPGYERNQPEAYSEEELWDKMRR